MNLKEKYSKELTDILNSYADEYWPKCEPQIRQRIEEFLISKGIKRYDLPNIEIVCDDSGIVSVFIERYPESVSNLN